jgi:hypothetical protein
MAAAVAPSRLLRRLDMAIAKAGSPSEAACLRAERASVLARQGQVERARVELGVLRQQFEDRPQVALSAWIALADGLADYYNDLSTAGRDKLMRAHALAAAADLRPLRTLAAAWLAHIAFVQRDAQRMARMLGEALRNASPKDHRARSRCSIVAAYGYHFCNRLDRAQPWYARAREHATVEGDEAALSALMHNRAWYMGWCASKAHFFGGGMGDLGVQALLAAESIEHFDRGVGTASLSALVPMLRAHMLTLLGRPADALPLFAAQFEAALAQGLARMQANFLADRAACHLALGHADAARADVVQAEAALDGTTDADDRAIAQARLAQVCEALSEPERARRHRQAADADHAAHRADQRRLADLLDDALEGLQPPR